MQMWEYVAGPGQPGLALLPVDSACQWIHARRKTAPSRPSSGNLTAISGSCPPNGRTRKRGNTQRHGSIRSPFPSSTHLPQKHQTSLKGMAAWPCSGEHEFFSKKILPNPDSSIYFLPHGRRKAPVIQSGCSSGVERNLAKVDVVGSNPIIRSIF